MICGHKKTMTIKISYPNDLQYYKNVPLNWYSNYILVQNNNMDISSYVTF